MAFRFVGYDWIEKSLCLRYAVGDTPMIETWTFGHDWASGHSREAADRAAFGLWVMAGVSYWKSTLDPEIIFETGGLTQSQSDFFSMVWQRGLGEFFYQNDLDPAQTIPFQATAEVVPAPILLPNLMGAIVPLGGGKDSLTTLELLKKGGKECSTWTINASKILAPQLAKTDVPHMAVSRIIDKNLLELNTNGALNGHVPMSAIYAFAGVLSAILTNAKYVILSNERSANSGNLVHKGIAINHQWSKSWSFEIAFRDYVSSHISPDIEYFSLLREMSEYAITKRFKALCWQKYKTCFMSCNRNFRLSKTGQMSWCGECPKCAFVACMLSAFVSPKELWQLFEGENLFTKKELKPIFDALLGLTDVKPFECVGEADEVAFALAQGKKQYSELAEWNIPLVEKLPPEVAKNAIPAAFKTLSDA